MTTPSSGSPGYLTDVEYPWHFQRETMPAWLCTVLTARGRRTPDLARPYRWLELGCGTGLNTLIAAAANPAGQFIGVDFNAGAIARAQSLAREAGLANASFRCQPFEACLSGSPDDLPTCDFIVSHGVYSWVGEQTRAALRRIAAQRLAPGGVLYLAYMSHPGSASFAAAQRLMRMATRSLPGNSADRARAAIALLQRMAQSGAGYFHEHPGASREVQRMAQDAVAQNEARYLAHEFLNVHWDVFHAADVMADLEAAGCVYAGSAEPLENIDAVSIPGAVQPLLAELRRQGADAAQLETARDLARNQNRRLDIYQRRSDAPLALPPDAHRAALLALRFALLPAAPAPGALRGGEIRLETRIGPVSLPVAQAAPLVEAMQSGTVSYADAARLPAYRADPGLLNPLFQTLTWAGWMHPVPPGSGTGSRARELNTAFARCADLPSHAAASAVGTGVPMSPAQWPSLRDGAPTPDPLLGARRRALGITA